ncbi:serine-protein kinase ATM-like isoform X2 [Gigantopelta aegis]|uniref:serine-protein kinase ATM-like isoform X2 n=1 Tax=Gigantopelta aegis TaxID=1735272 RepID=UPI001B88C1A4|nr:serine-protein kinase ATM-like isoform X2 [Gigantopelta aegis]
MDSLSDVCSSCRGLDTDKVSDRKKSVEKLRLLLGKSSVVKALDRNTEDKHAGPSGSRLITWNDIFKAVVVYIKLETAALKKAKEPQSRTASLNKDKKKQEISGFFKFFIRVADKRGPRLKCIPVISHILETLRDDFTCSAFGQDYNTILLKNILPVRKYWVELKPETWHELLIQYCRLYLDSECGLDHVILSRLINIIVHGSSRQCDLPSKKVVIFFTEAFKNIRQEKVSQVSEHLLSALNVFSKKIAPSSRIQLLKLGETIFVSLLYLWSNRPTDSMKDEIVEFMRLQLHLHHPCGAKSVQSGAAAVDWDSWKSSLRKLYEVIHCDLQQMGGRTRFMSSAKDCALSFPYVDLGADVCNQLFSDSTYVIEVTQLTMLGDGDASTPNKKRRLESGWSSIIDILAGRNNNLQIIPWLQLVSRLVEKYPASIPGDQLLPLLQCLSQLLTDCKRSDILRHLFGCLEKIVHGYQCFGYIPVCTLTSSRALWLNIWSASLRTMSSHYAEVEGFQEPGFNLLTSIMEQRLVVPERVVWNLFLPSVSFPTEASVRFLATFLRLHDLPENYKPNILGSILANEHGTYPLRKHLFDWFIPKREVSEVGSRSKNMAKIDPELVGCVLTSLTVRSTSSVLESCQCVSEENFSQIENLYLQTSFDEQVNFEKTVSSSDDTECADVSHIPVLLKHLTDVFDREKMYFEELVELQLQNLEDLVYQICLVSKCLENILHYQLISVDMIPVLGLDVCLQGLLKKLTSGLADFIKKDGPNQLLSFIVLLDKLFVWTLSKGHSTFVVSELIRTLMPSKLINQLFDVAFDKFSKTSSSAHKSDMDLPRITNKSSFDRKSTPAVTNRSHILDDIDDMDIEFDDTSTIRKDDNLNISFDDDELGQSQDSEEMTSQPDVCVSLLSRKILSDSQRLRLEFIRVLCHSSGFERSKCSSEIPYKAELDSTLIKCRLLQLLDDKLFDASRPLELQILEIIVNELTTTDHNVSETDLESMICVLRLVAKSQWHDQEVSSLCLDLLSRLVPQLTDSHNMPLPMAKTALLLVSAFRKLQDDGTCSSLAMTKCLQAFVECDPTAAWSNLKSSNDSDNTNTILSEFPNCLLDSCQTVRMYAAQAFQSLFVMNNNGLCTPKEKQLQLSAFDRIYEVCNVLLDIKGKLSSERMQDERNNRTTSSLLALATVACTSPVCEKNCLFAFCQLIKEKNLEITPIQKVLHKIANTLGYRDVKSYIGSHLPFLVHQWLDLEYPIVEFPFELMSMTSKTMFYREYTSILVPELLIHQELNSIREVAVSLDVDYESLLRDCVPVIVVHILPLFAASKTQEAATDAAVRKRTSLASKCYELLEQQISKEEIDSSILHHIDKIIVNILMCLYDEREMEGGDGGYGCDPDPNPPCYNSYIIKSTLDYLTQSFSGNSKSLVSVLAKTQDSIQKVLLELSIHLSHEHRMHEKRRILHMYHLFVGMLLHEFDSQLGGSWAFVFRDIVFRLVHILRDVNKSPRNSIQTEQRYIVEIIDMCLDLLYNICHVGVEICPQELVKYVPRIISNTLVCVAEDGQGDKAHRLLHYLMVENGQLLKDGMINLDPFPDKPCFHKYTKIHNNAKRAHHSSLGREIKHFVDVYGDHQTLTERSVEGIRYLQTLLASESTDLSSLVQQCHENEDGSLLCQLVCKLLHLAQCPVQPVSQEATCCLGIIGPVDLCAISLPKPALKTELRAALAAFCGDINKEKYCTIFHQLNDYLVDPCIDVVKSAGEVLKTMFATKEGAEFYAMYKMKLPDGHLLSYLHPFRPAKKKMQLPANVEDFDRDVDCDMWIVHHADYDIWLTDITCALLQSGAVSNEMLRLLKPICTIKSKFCEAILPFLIHDILLTGSRVYHAILSNRISSFFHEHCQLVLHMEGRSSTTQLLSGETSICLNKDAVQTMLNIVQYLRQQDRPKQNQVLTQWDNNFWLDIDYLEVAKAAQFCSAYFSTILYSEIWSDTKRGDDRTSSQSQSERVSQEFSQNTRMDALSSPTSSQTCVGIQDLMLEAYRCIGDPDGIYGCGAGRLADSSSRVKTYLHENKWEKAVITYDIEMKNAALSHQLGLLQTIQNFGAESMLELCLQGISTASQQNMSPEVQELQYEAAWRAGQWNLNIPSRLDSGMGFHQALYCALDALKDGQMSLSKIAVNTARLSVLKSGDVNLESCRSIYPVLCKLHCLAQVDDVLAVTRRKDGHLLDIVEKWNSEKLVTNDFEFLHPVLNIRCSLIKLLMRKCQDKGLQAGLSDHLHTLAQLARDSGRYQVSERCISDLKDSVGSDSENKLRVDLEEAELYWARAEHNIAKHLMKTLISNLEKLHDESFEAVRLLPVALGTYGNWLAETRSENPSVIMDNYLQRAVDLLEVISASDDLALEAYVSLAQFVDAQYQNIVNYMKSSTYEAKRALMKKAKKDAKKYKTLVNNNDRYLRTLEKQSKIDEQEVVTMEEDRNTFLEKAVGNYIKCLKLGDKHDLRVFRLTSLWFENASSDVVNQLLNESVPFIKSYKFLPLLYQLAARLSTKQNNCVLFQPTLEKILETAAVDHPHHGVPVIMGLAHANKDAELEARSKSAKRGGKLSRSNTETEGEEDRVQAAKNMIEKLKRTGKVSVIVRNLEILSTAYIELANWSVEQFKKETKAINLPGSLMLTQLKNLDILAVPTVETKVDPSGKYDDIVSIQRFVGTFKLAGGINLPKILTIVGSDGIERRQLVKGRDDLRQDAVMQQVFGMLNNLLKKNPETRKRSLRVRTYKVIPLSQRSGLLEWCEGTQPIGEYLIGSSSVKGAHQKYYPQDWPALDCRKHITVTTGNCDVKKKLKLYLEACKHFHPVFRQFFMEKFSDPATWFERRLAYTRSVATNSIVGYILGLGDRHIMNILIDCNTAELIHIDLGIAFEQGRILPTPETVPFRLTRDIVDGMGVTGVEGVFRRSCEKTMEVMHVNQEVLLMILQVLLYDPLYVWTLSPQKAYALQNKRDRTDPDQSELNTTSTSVTDIEQESSGSEGLDEVNKVAERVLLRLQQKLQGVEDGIQLSIMGQVNYIIQEARDPKNLCKLFPGWQPYI